MPSVPFCGTTPRATLISKRSDKQAYFDLVLNGKDAVYSMDRDGKPTATHTYWKGFKRGTAVGLILEHALPKN